jgi:signal transduction histidine kinase
MSNEVMELPRRILVLDDNPDIHRVFQAILVGEEGHDVLDNLERDLFNDAPAIVPKDAYDVECALQGQDGLKKVEMALSEGNPFMVAFVDMRMPPGWDGLETIEHMWQVDPNMQIVICTAYSDYSWHEIVRRLGKTDNLLLLKKPFDPAEAAQVATALVHKWMSYRQATLKMGELESMVADRTRALEAAKADLDLLNKDLERQVNERTAEVMDLLRQKEAFIDRLARSNTELEQFAFIASHDLMEPVRQMRLYVQLLSERYKGRLDDDADVYIEYAIEGTDRMQSLVHGLGAYSMINASPREFHPVSCGAVVQRVLTKIRRQIDEAGAEVTYDSLPKVIGDGKQLEQLFENLISNALKFRGNERPRVHVSAVDRESDWLFSVHDNGIGIEPQYFDRIFVVFERLHLGEDYPGVGIGLTLCKKIVERHDGSIWVESEPGHGSTFHFTISKSNCGSEGHTITPQMAIAH